MYICGEVNFSGSIIVGGNLYIVDHNKKVINSDKGVVNKLIASNYDKLKNLFKNNYDKYEKVQSDIHYGKDENISNNIMYNKLINMCNWKIIK
ncbi:hypothetical protein ACFIJ5_05795 [Haloimpatiens sp. FM7330]|uniref:hypothetical protein n=1 Tax=Haloimpatiens sp. FM7330 TaxID=3298610 RepID=UPI0036412420